MKKATASSEVLDFYWREKKKRHPAYSMRALARDLKTSQSFVSEILSGKKRLPAERISRWASVLGIDGLALENLKRALFAENFREERPTPVENAAWDLKSAEEVFLSHWSHPVILELVECGKSEKDIVRCFRSAGLTGDEVLQTLHKLIDLGYLKRDGSQLRKAQKKLRLATARSMPAVRRFHKQMIDRAASHLMTHTQQNVFQRRLISGITISANPERVERARARLEEAMHEVADILMEGNCSEVYQLNVQFFNPLEAIAK